MNGWVPTKPTRSAFFSVFAAVFVPAVPVTWSWPVGWRSIRVGSYWLPARFGWTLVNPVPSPSLSTTVPGRGASNSRAMPVAGVAVVNVHWVADRALPARSVMVPASGTV